MNARQAQAAKSLHSSAACARRELARFKPPSERLAAATSELEATVRQMERVIAEQYGATVSLGREGLSLSALRNALREDHLLIVAKRGKTLLRGLPGIRESLHVPHKKASHDEILKAAERISAAVKPHAAAFYAARFPKDFIAQLDRAAAAFAAALADDTTETAVAQRSRATAMLKRLLREAREIIDAMDIMIKKEYADAPGALSAWAKAKRIPRRTGRPKKRS
jgi:hypothetical protein